MEILQRKIKESVTVNENKSYLDMEEKDQEGVANPVLFLLRSLYVCWLVFCLFVFVNLPQARFVWRKNLSGEMPPSDWHVSKCVEIFLIND